MTKYEWERQLKKGISGLPKSEQQRVLDYYNELFADKIDAGLREQYIISEFGNPYDVANKILVDYYNGDKENPEVDAYIYADSDDIDDAFDDAADVKTTEPPKRKTWAEKKDERREERKARHEERYDVDEDEDESEDETKSKGAKNANGLKSVGGLVTILCVTAYLVLGACFNLWHPGWLIFLAMPCVITLIEAIVRRNWRIFAYPVFATFVFLLIGFNLHKWHPAWIIFITIPLYYILGDFIYKNAKSGKSDNKQNKRESNYEPNPDERSRSERRETDEAKPSKKASGKSSNVFAIIAKVLLTVCLILVAVGVWWLVISLFVGGIGMIVGGIALFATSVFVGSSVNALIMGAAFAVLGLGLICVFGMAATFKPCVKMCKSFIKTIRNCFDAKEAE